MGKFIQKTIDIRQTDKDGVFKTLSNLTFVTEKLKGKKYERIFVKAGYITDGYSKPFWSKSLVGGSFGDDLRPAVIHDFLCQNKGYYVANTDYYIPVTFKEANDIFYEAMRAVGINRFKAYLMYLAVFLNKNRW